MSIPYKPQKTKSRFYVPYTLQDDFDTFLQNDIPGSVGDFILIKDWYDQLDQDYEDTIIRGEIYPDSTKSRYSDTDNNLNFRASVDSGIRKGDMLIDHEGEIYLLDWHVAPQPNNRASRSVRCNARLTFTRYEPEEVDERGYLVHEAGQRVIAEDMPCNGYTYDGRPEYSSHAGSPGITPNALRILSVQYNKKTKNLRIDDEFIWGAEAYVIVDINLVDLDISGEYGVLVLQAKKKAGGML